MVDEDLEKIDIKTIKMHKSEYLELSDWQCQFWSTNFVIIPPKGREPNWIQRWLSSKIFGVKWCRRDDAQ